jgi:hypothetical protein
MLAGLTGRRDSGGATAEFTILLPAAVLIAAAMIGVAGQQLQAGSLGQKVGLLARAVELGRTDAQLRQLAESLGVQVSIASRSGLTCIEANTQYKILGVPFGAGTSSACGLRPGA